MTSEVITVFTEEDRDTFAKCEKDLDDNKDAFMKSIRAMMIIRDRQLFRIKGYTSFEAYLKDRNLEIARTRQRADQLISHMLIREQLQLVEGVTDLPENERQSRELKGIRDAGEMAAAWVGAQQASGSSQPSGSWVRSSRETLEQLKMKNAVHTGDGRESPPSAANFARATANTELERVQRWIDHIRAGRKQKPVDVVEVLWQECYEDQDEEKPWTFIGVCDGEIKLERGKKYRAVFYEIVEEKKPEEVQEVA